MNHDATHCADYEPSCPKSCYRAKLTRDLQERTDLFYLPISWSNFRGSSECPRAKIRNCWTCKHRSGDEKGRCAYCGSVYDDTGTYSEWEPQKGGRP